jgi:hypothetical protein
MNWWKRLSRRTQLEVQLEKELSFHLERHSSQLSARGIPPDEARRQARLALGGREQVKERCRDARGTRCGPLTIDLRYHHPCLPRCSLGLYQRVAPAA